jgi:hypothetical protein
MLTFRSFLVAVSFALALLFTNTVSAQVSPEAQASADAQTAEIIAQLSARKVAKENTLSLDVSSSSKKVTKTTTTETDSSSSAGGKKSVKSSVKSSESSATKHGEVEGSVQQVNSDGREKKVPDTALVQMPKSAADLMLIRAEAKEGNRRLNKKTSQTKQEIREIKEESDELDIQAGNAILEDEENDARSKQKAIEARKKKGQTSSTTEIREDVHSTSDEGLQPGNTWKTRFSINLGGSLAVPQLDAFGGFGGAELGLYIPSWSVSPSVRDQPGFSSVSYQSQTECCFFTNEIAVLIRGDNFYFGGGFKFVGDYTRKHDDPQTYHVWGGIVGYRSSIVEKEHWGWYVESLIGRRTISVFALVPGVDPINELAIELSGGLVFKLW